MQRLSRIFYKQDELVRCAVLDSQLNLPYTKDIVRKELTVNDRRNLKRKKFAYYMRVLDDETLKLIGHLSDISAKGFKIDSQHPIAPGLKFRLRMDLTSEVSNKSHILFSAITRWSRVDPADPFVQNVGFEITEINTEDAAIYQRIVDKYGT